MTTVNPAQLKPIKVFDTQSNQKHLLETLEPGKVKMYVCGVTVYDLTHIGHARVFIVFDVVQRFLRHLGYDVTYVRNHTDVDDKIIARAKEVGRDPLELAAHFIDELNKDMGALGVANADIEPKVTDHIEPIIEMVQTLIDKGYAYVANGDVYYRVKNFESYGKLSHRKLDDMEAGRSGRVAEGEGSEKEHPFDFALWKSAKDDDYAWDSPWGKGRPGWHIECSAMSTKYLGAQLDIHGGGRDLIFPHHENEIAQSEAATGHGTFAKYWMHVGMVNVAETADDGSRIERKMSKSLGNFWTTRDVLNAYHPEAIRYFMQTSQYRNPITYSSELLDEATERVDYLYSAINNIDETLARAGYSIDNPPPEAAIVAERKELIETAMERFDDALADDFCTPRVLAILGEMARAVNEITASKKKPKPDVAYTLYRFRQLFLEMGSVLGLLQREPQQMLKELCALRVELLGLDADLIDAKVLERNQARNNKDWAKADALRDELDAMNVEIMDSPTGTTWRIKC